VIDAFIDGFGLSAEALEHRVTLGNGPPLTIIGVVKGMDYMSEYFSPSRHHPRASS
jgi:hypothetical protein